MKLLILLLLTIMYVGCFPGKLHQKEEVIRYQYDSAGRLTAMTFRKVIYSDPRVALATITREYDVNGNVTAEYGFNHPEFGAKYMIKSFFNGGKPHIENWFAWPAKDLDSSFGNYEQYFVRELIRSAGDFYEIELRTINDSMRNVFIRRSNAANLGTKPFEKLSEINTRNIGFDKNGRFIHNNSTIKLEHLKPQS